MASKPSRTASSTSSSGWEAPSRNEKFEWQCSSAYGTVRGLGTDWARSDWARSDWARSDRARSDWARAGS